jgi:hypothetical protein
MGQNSRPSFKFDRCVVFTLNILNVFLRSDIVASLVFSRLSFELPFFAFIREVLLFSITLFNFALAALFFKDAHTFFDLLIFRFSLTLTSDSCLFVLTSLHFSCFCEILSDKGMFEHLLERYSFLRIFFKKFVHEIFEFAGNIWKTNSFARNNRVCNFFAVFTRVRLLFSDEN